MEKLIEQIPAIVAIIIVVFAFLQAQAKRDDVFLQAQAKREEAAAQAQVARDRMFLDAIHENGAVVTALTREVGENTKILIEHDSTMRVTAKALENGQKRIKNGNGK